MTTKKTGSAAADAQKKRKRDKMEDSRRLKKRKPQEEEEAADESTESSMAVVATQAGQAAKKAAAWKLLEPMGGCISDVDPVFTADETHLILTYNTSIQVYSTEDSLLERRIRLPDEAGAASRRIVATVLSPVAPELVWVGCADGALFRISWKTGAVEPMPRRKQAKEQTVPQLADMAVDVVSLAGGKPKEVLFLSEGSANVWQVAAYEADALAHKTGSRTHLFSHPGGKAIDQLRTADQGRVVVGAQGSTLFVAGLKRADSGQAQKLAYEVFAFDAADEVASLDVRAAKETQIDVVVGCVRGAIYVYGDVLKRLQTAAAGDALKKKGIKPRKHHWHSRTVYAVKWSRDGQYFISGGQENVLVMWQTDTGRLEVLPHLAASIENIVVSPRGASYAVHLDDNSAMVLSTAEMKPTCYVSGVQSLTLSETPRKDVNVRRVWQPAETIARPVPAVVSPTDPSRLLVRVSNGQKAAKTTDEWPSASLLQTFDIAAFQSIGKQPLARTNPTDRNLTKDGFPVTEPTITHLCTSRDGRWLASVDEWQPPARDISGIAGEPSLQGEWARERREVHLKFWSVEEAGENGSGGSYYELVTRVDEAHFTTRAESIFAVAADTGRTRRFATLGDDGIVRFWGLRQRVQNGVQVHNRAGQPVVSWHCTQAVELPLGAADVQSSGVVDGELVAREPGPRGARSGALTFSEDGSTVFAAFGAADEALLYVLDAESGAVRNTLSGLFRGHVRGLDSLGPALLLLSEDVRVYDVVADELRYAVRLDGPPQTSALSQLAVARQSQTFAVAVAVPPPAGKKWPASRLLLFSPDQAEPLFARELPHLVVSLLPAVGASGFLALDASAQIWSAVHAADTASLGQPLAALGLTGQQQEVVVSGDVDSDEDQEMEDEDTAEMEDDDDDDNYAIIAPQKLRDIFEAAPATAASIEELFWEVSGLLTALPPVVPAGRS